MVLYVQIVAKIGIAICKCSCYNAKRSQNQRPRENK